MRPISTLPLLAVLTLGCGASEGAAVPPVDGPIVLISLDTLRADHLPEYGYDAIRTPAIDSLAQDSVLFEQAFSPYPLTLPAHASVVTGLNPTRHGLRDNIGYSLAPTTPHLAEALRQRGYATAGFVSSHVLRRGSGLEHGFDVYDDLVPIEKSTVAGSERSGEITLARAAEWVAERENPRWLLLLHFYEPHTPYEPPPRHRLEGRHPYDGEIVWTDELVDRFLQILRRHGVYDAATIVLFSDHGEGLGDHGEQQHGLLLYRESLHVPLLLKLPEGRLAGTRRGYVTGLTDIAPTLAQLAGVDLGQPVDGRSLLDPEPRSLYAETHYGRLHLGWGSLTSLIDADLRHYIKGPERAELFDLRTDREERDNLASTAARRRLHQRLLTLESPLSPPSATDPEHAQELRALGYLAAGGGFSTEDPHLDPRDEIDSLGPYWKAVAPLGQQRWKEAETLLSEVVVAQPQMRDAWEQLGFARLRQGEQERALEAFQQALEISHGDSTLLINVGNLLCELGRYGEARAHAEAARSQLPHAANLLLATIALVEKDVTEAVRYADLALQADATRPAAWLVYARALARLGNLDGAQQAAVRAASAQRNRAEGTEALEGYELTLGDIAGRRGSPAEAERHFRREIARFPRNLDAYTHLAVLLASTGDRARSEQVLAQMTSQNPSQTAAAARERTLAILDRLAGMSAATRGVGPR